MRYEFLYLLELVGCAAQGKIPTAPTKKINWELLLQYAQEQSVVPLVALALKYAPPEICSEEKIKKSYLRDRIIASIVHNEAVLELLQEMEKNGLRTVVLKGMATAQEYAVPECRISADTDILVDLKEEKLALRFLKEYGFSIHRRTLHSHHSECYHPKIGCVELHIREFESMVEDVWLKDCIIQKEPRRKIFYNGLDFYTLGITDGFIFMNIHIMKHFINGGISIQMMTDLANYILHYRAEIDWERAQKIFDYCNFSVCLQTIFAALITYGGFSTEIFPRLCDISEERSVMLLLEDVADGGWLGQKNKYRREEGLYIYNRRMILKKTNQIGYVICMLNWYSVEWILAIFPQKEYMHTVYPWLKNKGYLLPIAWAIRLFGRGTSALLSGKATHRIVLDENNVSQEAQDRIKLFSQLEILRSDEK